MQVMQRSASDISSILGTIRRMARKQGAIGINEPDDIAQNAMLKLLTYDGPLPTGPLIYTIVRWAIADAFRIYARESGFRFYAPIEQTRQSVCERTEAYRETETPLHAQKSDVEPDLMPHLKKVLGKLSKPLRQALMLQVEGYSYEEIARMTNVNIGTVRSRIHYARKRARLSKNDIA